MLFQTLVGIAVACPFFFAFLNGGFFGLGDDNLLRPFLILSLIIKIFINLFMWIPLLN